MSVRNILKMMTKSGRAELKEKKETELQETEKKETEKNVNRERSDFKMRVLKPGGLTEVAIEKYKNQIANLENHIFHKKHDYGDFDKTSALKEIERSQEIIRRINIDLHDKIYSAKKEVDDDLELPDRVRLTEEGTRGFDEEAAAKVDSEIAFVLQKVGDILQKDFFS